MSRLYDFKITEAEAFALKLLILKATQDQHLMDQLTERQHRSLLNILKKSHVLIHSINKMTDAELAQAEQVLDSLLYDHDVRQL